MTKVKYRGQPITQKYVSEWVRSNPGSSVNDLFVDLGIPNVEPKHKKLRRRIKKRFMAAHENMEQNNTRRPLIGGVLDSPEKRRDKAGGRTFVFTSAQSNTFLHEAFFRALERYCDFKGAELHISRFTYNKQGLGAANSKAGSDKDSDTDDTWFDPKIEPYVSDAPLEITPDLVWCGELNIIPTRVNPISGFQNYTRRASSIIPHAKMFMESVPTMKHEPAKMIYTTGAVTQRNYIQKAAGQKADFHHVFGAVVVEVDEDGTWWARQLNADSTGAFYDLDLYVDPEGIIDGQRVQAVTHGDLHGNKLDPDIANAVFRDGGILDCLLPREQFFHDTIDFQPRNHHNIKDPHFWHEMYINGTDSVENELDAMATFLMYTAQRDWCKSFVVVSNHDQALNGWLRNTSALYDPPNIEFWHYMNLEQIRSTREGQPWHPFGDTVLRKCVECTGGEAPVPIVLEEDSSYRILGQIEAALHGHLGPSGARGTPRNIRSAGKVNSGHTHSAGIFEGVYTAGVYGKLDMGYNKGLSSWSHSMVVTYPNAKRTILTIKKGKAWR